MTGAYLPLSTHAENYGPFPTLAYAYEQGVTAVVGENGAGKSFVVNAPAVALFGHTPDGVSLGDLLSNFGGADRMTVTHEFMAGGERYRVRRSWSSRAGGKQTLDLEHNWTLDGEEPWVPMTKESIRETQAEIERLLGFTRETFLASALQLQSAPSFASRGTSRVERCDLLIRGLGLQYDAYKDLAERDRKNAERQAGVLQVKLVAAEQELAEFELIRALHIDHLAVVDRRASRLVTTEGLLEALLDQQRQAEQRTSERRAAEAELAQAEQARLRLREQAAAADIARDSIEVTREMLANLASEDDLREAEESYRKACSDFELREHQRKYLHDALEAIGDAVCHTCLRPFENAEEIHEQEAAFRRLLDKQPALPTPSDHDLIRARGQATERARLEERIAAWQQTIDMTESEEFSEAWVRAEESFFVAAEKLDALPPIDQAECDRITQQTLEARAHVNEQRQRLDEARAEKAKLEAVLDRFSTVERQAAADRAEHERLCVGATVFSALETMYGRDGLPSLVIENVAVPYLEQQATEILHRLGKPWAVEIHLGKETKAGTIRPALDVKVITESGAVQRYEQCSGGEQCRLDVALHVAFVRLWKQRSGSWSELYAIDEPEGLDADGMNALVDVLDFLATEFKIVNLVSHHSELRDSIGQTVEVSRNGRGSSVGAAA